MGYTLCTGLPMDAGNTGNFRTWGGAMHDAFANCGWVQANTATDAGQIDWTSVTAANAANQTRGYEIWSMNDALQATAPVTLKIQYGSGINYAGSTRTLISIGRLPSGNVSTGNLTFPVSAVVDGSTYRNNLNTTTLDPSWVCGSNNRIWMNMGWVNGEYGATSGQFFSIERTHDASGNDTAEGATIVMRGGGSSQRLQYQYWNAVTGSTPLTTSMGVLLPVATSGCDGNTLCLYPIQFDRGIMTYPLLNALGYDSTNIYLGSYFTVSHYAVNHSFIAFGNTGFGASYGARNGNLGLALRYE